MATDLRHLRYFLAVADAGHMTRAAGKLGLQQPPLSMQIRALEAELGCVLFERLPRGVALTAAGERLLPLARRLVDDAAQLVDTMRRVSAGMAGELTLGFTSSASAHALTPRLLRAQRQAYPDVHTSVREHNAAEIMEQVRTGALDAGLLRRLVQAPDGLRCDVLLEEDMLLALPLDHPRARGYDADAPLARLPTLALAHVADEPFILVRRPGAPGMYADLLARLAELGLQVRIAAEVERMMTNLNLVAAGAGVSVVPASMRGKDSGGVAYFRMRARERLTAPITLVYRPQPGHPALDALVALAHRLGAQTQARRAAT
ncbi:LysR family transcriptional regulator [Bordetella genomosp. 5]|uniref:LysR family transcriptional regulator n=1 Tax=Bordetella genomosp. 5 TaxID=1395608 RepID=A0A261T2N8_9BORD|nr:LysR family transcriptional regulator [Bordetella genomosp. 5]OZI36842.1 LysR family transcriptional regulator [Bordetella genomosp. 5]OZI43859.1 LysR family transcriptional regulator [Bordetella genomosp. 5]